MSRVLSSDDRSAGGGRHNRHRRDAGRTVRLRQEDIDAAVLKSVANTLTSFGIEEDDRRELRADFQHLRRWRRSVEQAQSYTFKAVITVIVTGFVGAVWLGIKATLGK